ncbi:MAG TPA: tetratricopeptide repeat protein [Ohtaekwangia sp.]|nr:tetratricopeptide repeat protein [Ohtaekwangia sp.]
MGFSSHHSFAFLFIVFCYNIAYSQSEREIVSQYRKALDQSVHEEAIKTFRFKGELSMQKLRFPMVLSFKAPSLMRIEMSFQDLTFLQVSNDSLQWKYNPMEDKHLITPVVKNEDGSPDQDETFDFVNDDLLNYDNRGYRLKLQGTEKIDSLEVYVLELTKDKKAKTKYFINQKTFLIYKVQDEKGYRYFSNYIKQDGFVFPHSILNVSKDQTLDINLSHLEFNVTLDDSLFVIPQSAFDKSSKQDHVIEAMLSRADDLYEAGNYDSAVVHYTKVIKSSEGNYRALNSRGLTKIQLKNFYEAIGDFNAAIEIDPSGSKAFNNLGLAKFYLGDLTGAIKDYSKAIELEPAFFIAFKNRGLAYINNRNFESAASDFKEAIRIKPEDGEAHLRHGVALAELGNFDDALASYNLAIVNNLKSAEVYNYKGVSQFRLEKYDSATVNFRDAFKLAPDNLQYLENYGRALYEAGDYKTATTQFELYLKKQSDNSDIHNLIGLCKFNDENFKGAIKDFTKSIELNGEEATYFDNRATAKEMIEDYEGAIKDYSESIRIYPNDASVFYKRGLVKLLTSKKLEGCMDLATANEMQYEPAKDAILSNCH